MGSPKGKKSEAKDWSHVEAIRALAENLQWLRDNTILSSSQAVEDAAQKNPLQIGRSSVDRFSKAQANATMENVQALADVYGLKPWKLLHPEFAAVKGRLPDNAGARLTDIFPSIAAEKLAKLGAEEMRRLEATIASRVLELAEDAATKAASEQRQRELMSKMMGKAVPDEQVAKHLPPPPSDAATKPSKQRVNNGKKG